MLKSVIRTRTNIVFVFLLIIFVSSFIGFPLSLLSQPTSSTISPKAFGSRSWRENGLAPLSLPITGNNLWDVRLANDGQIYYWNGSSWVSITSTGGEITHNHQADVIDIFDDGGYYTGTSVESALQENGASIAGIGLDISTLQTSIDSIVIDPRWSDARTPLAHTHSTSDVTSGTFADARISSSSVTQHETPLESVLDLQDLQGSVVDAQVPNDITVDLATLATTATTATNATTATTAATATVANSGDSATLFFSAGTIESSRLPDLSGLNGSVTDAQVPNDITKTGTASKCARFDSGGILTSASGDCVSGDTAGSGLTNPLANGSAATPGIYFTGGGASSKPGFYSDSGVSLFFAAMGFNRLYFDGNSAHLGLTSGSQLRWSTGSDPSTGYDTNVYKSGPSELTFGTTTGGYSALILGRLRVVPQVSPPCTCGSAGCEGMMYYDTSHALCVCGVSTWHNQTPSDGGNCS